MGSLPLVWWVVLFSVMHWKRALWWWSGPILLQHLWTQDTGAWSFWSSPTPAQACLQNPFSLSWFGISVLWAFGNPHSNSLLNWWAQSLGGSGGRPLDCQEPSPPFESAGHHHHHHLAAFHLLHSSNMCTDRHSPFPCETINKPSQIQKKN